MRPWTVGVMPGTRQPDMPPLEGLVPSRRPHTTPGKKKPRRASEERTVRARNNQLKPLGQGARKEDSRQSSQCDRPWFRPPEWLCEQYWEESAASKRLKSNGSKSRLVIGSRSRTNPRLTRQLDRSDRVYDSSDEEGQDWFFEDPSNEKAFDGFGEVGDSENEANNDVAKGSEDWESASTAKALMGGGIPAAVRQSLIASGFGLTGFHELQRADEAIAKQASDAASSKHAQNASAEDPVAPPKMPQDNCAHKVYQRGRKMRAQGYNDEDMDGKTGVTALSHSASSSSTRSGVAGALKSKNKNLTGTIFTLGNMTMKLTPSTTGRSCTAIRLPSLPGLPKDFGELRKVSTGLRNHVSFDEGDDEMKPVRQSSRGDSGLASRMSSLATSKSKTSKSLDDDCNALGASETPVEAQITSVTANPAHENVDRGETVNQVVSHAIAPQVTEKPTEDKPVKTQEQICSEGFRKFQDDHQLHRDDLPRALESIGITNSTLEWVDDVFDAITKFSTIGELEFLNFVQLYMKRQHQAYAEAFEKCDSDGSGYVEREELAALLKDLGVEPMNHVLLEVISEVDEDGQGSLDLGEFMKVMDIIRTRECFTKREYSGFLAVFNRFDQDGSGDMDTKELMNLLNWLGFTVDEREATEIVTEVDVDGTGDINEREFLICMRKVREREVVSIQEAFALCDDDGSGTINAKELDGTMRALGYVTDPQAVKDAIAEAGLDEDDDELDVSEFFRLLDIYRQREGLSADDIQQLEVAFHHYDKEKIGELSTLDVGKVLRYLGYPISYELQQTFIAKVDVDRSTKLQFAEMKKLLRMYRELEIEAIRDAYDAGVAKAGIVTPGTLAEIVDMMELPGGMKPQVTVEESDITKDEDGRNSQIEFLQFVQIVSRALREARAAFREDGGFTKKEVEELKVLFDVFDADGSADISNKELIRVIETLFPLVANDPTMRPKLLELLAEVDQDGNGSLDFSDFLQLMRQFNDLTERESAAKEQQAIDESGLTQQEVNDYREIFLENSETYGTRITLEETLIIFSRVCPLGDKNANDLATMFHNITGRNLKSNAEPRDEADFADFLLLIKQMLNLNFAGIQDRTAPPEK